LDSIFILLSSAHVDLEARSDHWCNLSRTPYQLPEFRFSNFFKGHSRPLLCWQLPICSD